MTADFGELYSPNFLFLSHLSILQLVRQTTFIFKSFIFFFKIPSLMVLSTFHFEQIPMQNQKPSAGWRVISSVSNYFSGPPAEIHLWYIKRQVPSGQTLIHRETGTIRANFWLQLQPEVSGFSHKDVEPFSLQIHLVWNRKKGRKQEMPSKCVHIWLK